MRAWVFGVVGLVALFAACTGSDRPVVLSSSTLSTSEPWARTLDPGYPAPGDHLHYAFGIFVCDHFLPPLVDRMPDVTGIHTHADGIVHVHPFSSRFAGPHATFAVFADTVGLEVDADSVTLPDGTVLPDEVQCEGAPAEFQAYTSVLHQPTQLVRWGGDPGVMPLNSDRGAIVLAAVAPGTTVPPPPSIATLDELSPEPAPPTTR
jgi:hypothetical protein